MASRGRKTRTSQQAESSSREEISINDSEDEIATSTTTKRTVITKSTEEKPCATSTPQKDGHTRAHRAVSPLTITRSEEKEELAHLNDRFASYIDYVRSLEIAKDKLTKKMQSISKTETVEVDKIKKVYEDELRSLRQMVDDLAKERANLEIDLKNARDEKMTFRKKLEKRDVDLASLQRKMESLEKDLLKQRADSERYMSLLSQHDGLEKKCAKLNKDLDAEILLRTDVENKNVTLKEQLEFNERLYNEEHIKLRQTQVIIEEEIEDRKHAEYESRLAEELRAIREETAEEFESYKMEFEQSFILRLADLKKNNEQTNENAVKARDEMMMWRSKAEKFDQELAAKLSEIDLLKKRIREIESLLSYERNEFEEQLKQYRDESNQLRLDLQKRLDDFSNLMSTKIALDQEILMYRKMLEGEEARCNISVAADGDTGSFSVLNAGSKRRKVGERGEYTTGGSDDRRNTVTCGRESYKVDLVTRGAVEFSSKPDCTGRFVKITNQSDKDVGVGGWTLRYVADNQETSYKFHHNLHIKARSDCTVSRLDTVPLSRHALCVCVVIGVARIGVRGRVNGSIASLACVCGRQ